MPPPLVSVVIPTYNRGHCIKEAIESVLAQSFQDFELIVIDDGSTDNTAEVVGEYGNRICYLKQANHGAAHARNTGIKASCGDWIAFLDSDDLWTIGKLKVQIEDLMANKVAVAHMVDAVIVGENAPKQSMFQIRGLLSEFRKRPFRKRPLGDVLGAQFFTSCWVLKRSAVENVGLFNQHLAIFEDFHFLTRIALEGAFYVNPYIGTSMRRKSGGASALSALYQKKRITSLNSLIQTYIGLKYDTRLNKKEYQQVCNMLGGVRCEIFEEYKKQKKWKRGLEALFQSIIDDPGIRSVLRASVHAADAGKFLKKLRNGGRDQNAFRRSEIEKRKHSETGGDV